jgi:hypothetical protein
MALARNLRRLRLRAGLTPQATPATLNVTAPADMPCDVKIAAKPPAPSAKVVPDKTVPDKPAFPWAVQLIGDRSKVKALACCKRSMRRFSPTTSRRSFAPCSR